MSPGAIYPEQYQDLLNKKADRIRTQFAEFNPPELEVFASNPANFRMRAEFRIWHEEEQSNYVMFQKGRNKDPIIVNEFPQGSLRINELMQPLMVELQKQEVLRWRLFQVEFLTTQTGEALVTLIYHKPLQEDWLAAVKPLQESLDITIIGRSRKQKLVLEQDYVTEELTVAGQKWRYQQVENSFTQPNVGINEKMLAWALDASRNSDGDLVELYCGNANFTCVLAQNFDKVLATEISKTSVNSARYNFELNTINNIEIGRMSSEEFTQAMNKVRAFQRLSHVDLDSYDFRTIFVDPPRAGLDQDTEKLVQGYDSIMYISCNPDTLKINLDQLCQTHQIERFALFDQFPYTDHCECGVILKKK